MTREQWIAKCNDWKDKWPVITQDYLPASGDTRLNIYAVLDAINRYCDPEDVLMGDAGSISYAGPVALAPKRGQRMIFSPAQADMGWALPAAIGAALASGRSIISITGDGSFMSNVQELAVARQHDLNIKFVLLNNGGYLSIKNTQNKFYEGRVYGTSSETGIFFPNFSKLADAFEIRYCRASCKDDLAEFHQWLREPGPSLIDCFCVLEQEILPAQAFKNGRQAGLHDMTPFLSEEELRREMLIDI